MENVHIGNMIAAKLTEQHKTKRELADAVGMSAGNAVYLTTRDSIDVKTLHRIGMVLRYNFFKHFPIDDVSTAPSTGAGQVVDEKDKKIDELKNRIAEMEKINDWMKRDLEMQTKENGYLKEINELLKKKQM